MYKGVYRFCAVCLMTVLLVSSVLLCSVRASATAGGAALNFSGFSAICTFFDLLVSGYTVAEATKMAEGNGFYDLELTDVDSLAAHDLNMAAWNETKAGFTATCKKAWDTLVEGADYTGKAISKAINKVLHSTDANTAYQMVTASKTREDFLPYAGTVGKYWSLGYNLDGSKIVYDDTIIVITPGYRVAGYVERRGSYDWLRIVVQDGAWSNGFKFVEYVYSDFYGRYNEYVTTSGTPERNIATIYDGLGWMPQIEWEYLDFPVYPTRAQAEDYVKGRTTDVPVTDVPTSASASGATDIPDNPYKTRGIDADVAGEWTGVVDVVAVIDDAIAKNPGLDIVDVLDLVITVPLDETEEGEGETDKPIVVPDVPPLRPEEDFHISTAIVSKFPFCIPFDLIKTVQLLGTEPVAPSFDFRFKIASLGQEYPVKIDFKQFESVAVVSRWFFRLLFILSLILITRKLIKG